MSDVLQRNERWITDGKPNQKGIVEISQQM